MSKAEHESTTSRNLEQILIDRNGALTAALIRIRALAGERRKDPDMMFILDTASTALATVAPAAAPTAIAAAYERWNELYTAQYSDDEIHEALAKEQDKLLNRIFDMRAISCRDVLAKVSMLREMENGGEVIGDMLLASIAADLESLAGKGGAT